MKVTSQNGISVYTVSGSNTTRSLPDWVVKKRKRSLKNDVEWQNRIELIQDFEFEEASQCIRVSEDGEYAMATGTYKPQHHTYHLPSLSLKYSRHHISLNLTFELLSSDYTKSIHLQADRSIEFHTPMGCHYTIRIPRYGRALAYQSTRAEVVVPAEGKEIYRLDLEAGRFLKPFEAEEGVKCVESVAVAERSHGLLAFGTDQGTVEFFDPRVRSRIGVLGLPVQTYSSNEEGEKRASAVTALKYHPSGLTLATGSHTGIVTLYDIRSPNPLLVKDQQYGFPIQNLEFLHTKASAFSSEPKVLSADKRIIKIWDQQTGAPWTSIEPTVDINDVCVVPDSGMIFTANEGPEMHSFFIPQLGPAPKWCSFLDSLTEEMAEAHLNDPDSYAATGGVDAETVTTYDNYKFLTKSELEKLNLDHLIGKSKAEGGAGGVLRPYMHGYFVDQRLYEEAKLIADPFEWERERRNLIRQKIEKERESRIRSKPIPKVKVNKRLAERIAAQEEKERLRAAKKAARKAAGHDSEEEEEEVVKKAPVKEDKNVPVTKKSLLEDDRFKALFENPEFAIDENTLEFRQLNPSTKPQAGQSSSSASRHGRTAAESEEDHSDNSSSDGFSDSSDNESVPSDAEGGASKKRSRKQTGESRSTKKEPEMRISTQSYHARKPNNKMHNEKSFETRMKGYNPKERQRKTKEVGGEKEISWVASRGSGRPKQGGTGGNDEGRDMGRKVPRGKDERRSASGNVMRNQGR
ncbi:WD40 repeat-like protein [Ascobolus immersus RN42]|uniref:WD40 repeat-like protein n=1 Tax=Ascobolus immersus RN42 TaxID=1160509 RepID=A0A3N4IPS3_ASCIM|nr:WD40 repeat-like protein [Ascobolus immersus RN42]